MNLPSLYPHQEAMRDELRKVIGTHRRVIACAPPGTGKTRLSKWILGAAVQKERKENQSGYVLFAVHRRGLVDNASGSFAESPALEHGVIMAGREWYGGVKVQVASIDTLLSWFCEDGGYSHEVTFDLIVYDECHSHHSKLQTFLASHIQKRNELGLCDPYVLGLSATPQAKGLSDVYQSIIEGPETQWLIENGYLSPFRYMGATKGKLDLLVKKGAEYTSDSVATAMDRMAGDLVRDWQAHASDRATVGFFPRRSHAREAMEALKAVGVWCEYVDGETPDEERRKVFAALNDGVIQYICNVGIVERGTDIPRIGCVQLCTAIGSIVRYRQMIGRGSRIHPEKTDCLVLDHGGNIQRHGFFEDSIRWSLDWTERPTKEHATRATIECPKCSAVYRGGMCRSCGYGPTPTQRKSQGLVFDGSELKPIEKVRKSKGKSDEELFIIALYKAKHIGLTVGQAWHVAQQMANREGRQFRMPAKFSIGQRDYHPPPRGHADWKRKVKHVYGI